MVRVDKGGGGHKATPPPFPGDSFAVQVASGVLEIVTPPVMRSVYVAVTC
jgi:hypothetical protein